MFSEDEIIGLKSVTSDYEESPESSILNESLSI